LDADALYFVDIGMLMKSPKLLCLLLNESLWESCAKPQTACNKHIKANKEDLIM
jgi:hypothetical protein